MIRQVLKQFLIYLAVAVAFGIFALFLAFPFHPTTILGWAFWVVFALPVYVILEFVAGRLFSRNVGRSISSSDSSVSLARVLVAVVFACAAIFLGGVLISSIGGVSGDFWATNFSSKW